MKNPNQKEYITKSEMVEKTVYIYQPNNECWESKIKVDGMLFGYRMVLGVNPSQDVADWCINIMQNLLNLIEEVGPVRAQERANAGEFTMEKWPDMIKAPARLFDVIYV